MVSIDNQTAIRLLERDRYRYLCELVALGSNIPPAEHVPRRMFGNAPGPGVLMMVQEFPHAVFATITAYDEAFLVECLDWLRASFGSFALQSPDERVLASPEVARRFELGARECYRCFVCVSPERVPPTTAPVCKLAAPDREAVERYPQEPESHLPSPLRLFERHVLEGRGEILAIQEEGEVVAYIACEPAYEEIWDVVFIHVREGHRGRGLGRQIAAAYARGRLAQGQIPYYSGVDREASERTALSAGFVCCRELHQAEASRK